MKSASVIVAVLLLPALAMGATMNLTVSGIHTVVAHPGDTVAVALTVDTPVAIAAFDGYLNASPPGVFTVSNYRLNPAFSFPSFTIGPNGLLNPTSPDSIGGLAFSNLGPGTVPLATFNLTISPSWTVSLPFWVTVINPLLSDGAGAPVPVDVSPLGLPEPTSALLLGITAACLRRPRRERSTP